MAATSDEEMDSLLSTLDQIYQDFKSGVAEIQSVKCTCKSRQRSEKLWNSPATISSKAENERLTRLYTECLNNVADQLERRSSSQGLKEEVKRMREECLSKEEEHMKAMELAKQDCAAKVDDLEAQISKYASYQTAKMKSCLNIWCVQSSLRIRGFMLEKATNEATIDHLQRDLGAHKSHLHVLASRLDHVQLDVESKYILEIQDLKDCLAIEQEEKNELSKKLQDLQQKELLVSRSKFVEQQRDSNSIWQVETLKTKIMKLRKENEILKRKLRRSDEGQM